MTLTEPRTDETATVAFARRASRFFAGSFAAFVALFLTMIFGLADRQSATADLAEEHGGTDLDVPTSAYAAALDRTNAPIAYLTIAVLALVSVVLFARACHALGRVAGRPEHPTCRAAVTLPLLGLLSFWGLLVAEQLLAQRQAWMLEHYWTVWQGALAVFIVTLAVSVVLIVVCLWPTGLARRTSVVVAILATLVALVTVTAGVPPILPILLGLVLAFNVKRAAAG